MQWPPPDGRTDDFGPKMVQISTSAPPTHVQHATSTLSDHLNPRTAHPLHSSSEVSFHLEDRSDSPPDDMGVSSTSASSLTSSSSLEAGSAAGGEGGGPSGAQAYQSAPPPRRRGLSKLRRRLSQTFRLSFHGSLSELASHASALTIHEEREDSPPDGGGVSLEQSAFRSKDGPTRRSRFFVRKVHQRKSGLIPGLFLRFIFDSVQVSIDI